MNELEQAYLAHHGVLGMRWGVRRYQNYDGSYTKKGMEHYRQSESKYNEKKSAYQSAKESGDKAAIKNAKVELKGAKKQLQNDYKQLKKDYHGDKGKELYRSGKTIGSNERKMELAGLIAPGTVFASKYFHDNGRDDLAAMAGVAGGLSELGLLGMSFVTAHQNKQLRAYYGHTRNRR